MRRVAALLLAAVMLLVMSGCSTLFDKTYYAAEPYEAATETADTEDAADSISSYAALRRAVSRLVAEHAESAELQFQNYEGNISQDISTACWEVKSSTALGAFAVDYISYDLSRIVSYYQAKIYITYKRSAYQMEAIESMENMQAMAARLDAALRAGETYLALEITAASVTAEAVRESVERAYYADPLASPVLPRTDVGVYPESGVSHVVEITMDYGVDGETLSGRRAELSAAVEELLSAAEQETDRETEDGASEEPAVLSEAERLGALCALLEERCAYDADGGTTAWDALCGGSASSEGLAMAMLALCRAQDIECTVVSGRMDNEPHMWNIVSVDGAYYHVDVSDPEAFLAGDEELWGVYWWDTSEYPACPAPYVAAEEASGEATDEPAEEPEI